ncbi:formate dehydrogenase accessory sulfurtransferase FdhD [Streptomyces sp. NPDC056883]|uniref:formate dehydrogenase accessory sulfurtransferase FdhD n=1 Tax=Streptomyces sp. NPDC056883 TaxID=3345959 RepID=UPI00369E2460
MSRVTGRRPVLKLRGDTSTTRPDTLAGEEPLEIRLGKEPLTVTMRTPGDDFDLVAGLLVSEGLAATTEDLVSLRYCSGTGTDGQNTYNVISAELRDGEAPLPLSTHRNLLMSSACGVCGKDTIEAVRTASRWNVAGDPVRLAPEVLYALPERLRARQKTFDATGGLHAAGLFTADGELLCAREDVGRHNAVDKVVGWALRSGQLPLRGRILMVSGRASFELTQKAAMAGIPVLAAVSAPSTLAVDLATELGVTVVGFLRGREGNVYTGAERLSL